MSESEISYGRVLKILRCTPGKMSSYATDALWIGPYTETYQFMVLRERS